jgi:hypothetical protein
MIHIAGSIHRSFVFPAELPLAFAYYGDLERVLSYLPHIVVVRAYAYDRFRVLYSSVELGVYRVRIFCDVQAHLDAKARRLLIEPFDAREPVAASAGPKFTTGQGTYSSQSSFADLGDQTRITYQLQLDAELPVPDGLHIMPGSVMNRLARNVTQRRVREIAQGFIERSIDAFPHWLAEMKNSQVSRIA